MGPTLNFCTGPRFLPGRPCLRRAVLIGRGRLHARLSSPSQLASSPLCRPRPPPPRRQPLRQNWLGFARRWPQSAPGFTFSYFLQILAITGNGIPDEIPPKTAFSEQKVNSNLRNRIPEIPGGIPDFQVENVIFLLQMLQTYEELNNLIEYFLYLLYIAMYNAY